MKIEMAVKNPQRSKTVRTGVFGVGTKRPGQAKLMGTGEGLGHPKKEKCSATMAAQYIPVPWRLKVYLGQVLPA